MAGTDDDVAVHDEVLDGHHAAARLAEQIVTVERRIERLRAHSRQQRMRILVRGPPQHSAEATRTVAADEVAAVEHKIAVALEARRVGKECVRRGRSGWWR